MLRGKETTRSDVNEVKLIKQRSIEHKKLTTLRRLKGQVIKPEELYEVS
jgi:hypothetical protein